MSKDTIQFWDTSALISLVLQEIHSPTAIKARDAGKRWMAWKWIEIEVYAALTRRKAKPLDFKSVQSLLEQFEFVSLGAGDFPFIKKLCDRHRLRSADAGHLFCLLRAKKLIPEISFVCFDDELSAAAAAEDIKVLR